MNCMERMRIKSLMKQNWPPTEIPITYVAQNCFGKLGVDWRNWCATISILPPSISNIRTWRSDILDLPIIPTDCMQISAPSTLTQASVWWEREIAVHGEIIHCCWFELMLEVTFSIWMTVAWISMEVISFSLMWILSVASTIFNCVQSAVAWFSSPVVKKMFTELQG